MADSKFERFKKMFPRGVEDMNVLAVPSPLPGPGGIAKAVVGRAVQSGARRFSDAAKESKGPTKMKDRGGLERRDPMEPRVVPSGRSKELEKAREGGGGVTKQKDRRGLDIKEKKPEAKESKPESREFKPTPSRVSPKDGPSAGNRSAAGDRRAAGRKASEIFGDRRAAGKKVSETSVNRTEKGTLSATGDRRAAGRKASETSVNRAEKSDKSIPPKPKLKPERKAKKEERKAPKRKAEGTKASKQRFKGNWVGAAPTEMQKRGGQKLKNSSLMRYLRSK
jgi:hypothetical protein